MAEGLVQGEGFATDASIIKADAQRQRGFPSEEIDWHDPEEATRPVREYLTALEEADTTPKPKKVISLTDPLLLVRLSQYVSIIARSIKSGV